MNASAEERFPTFDDFNDPSSLIYGIGNVGRQDDGLGWAFIDHLEAHRPRAHADLRRTYQLNLEDADLISGFARVLFVDATKDQAVTSFALTRPEPKLDFSFTSHAISVPSILATTRQCFGRVPEVYLLAIRGYEWELQMGLTDSAKHNLSDSLARYLCASGCAPISLNAGEQNAADGDSEMSRSALQVHRRRRCRGGPRADAPAEGPT